MEHDEMDPASLGARIGQRLAAEKSSAGRPAVAVRLLVEALVAQHPTVKLPQIAGDPEVKAWLASRGISAGQLRAALTQARRDLRGTSATPVARRPPRQRAIASEAAATGSQNTPTSNADTTPMLPLRGS